MKLHDAKRKRELTSIVLLCASALFAVIVAIRVGRFYTSPVRAQNVLKEAIGHNNPGVNDVGKYLADSKAIADELKKKNLFAPPPPKQHPVKAVSGILGNEAIIDGNFYKVGDKIGDAKIVAIEATKVRIEWDGKEKAFSPIEAAAPPGGPGPEGPDMAGRPKGPEQGAEMVVAGPPEQMGPRGRGAGFLSPEERARLRERWQNMSDEERQQFRSRMRERFEGRR
jgi:hypothetical protein